VALVTGAAQGLGYAIAHEFADEGAMVALVDINAQALMHVEDRLKTSGYNVCTYALDITDYEKYAKAISNVVEQWGHLDILVNNAAIAIYGTIFDDTLPAWRQQIAVNLEAVYMGSKMAVPYMVAQKYRAHNQYNINPRLCFQWRLWSVQCCKRWHHRIHQITGGGTCSP